MKISIIAAIGKNNELGKNNQLLWYLPNDLKHFKEITTGHPIIMGRKTFESIGKALPNRKNIVLTRSIDPELEKINDIEIATSIEQALQNACLGALLPSEVFVIGGAEIYRQIIEKADKLYITHIEAEDNDADSFFSIIDETKWKEIKREKFSSDEKNKFDYAFVEYERI